VEPKFPVLAVVVLLVAISLGVVAQLVLKYGLKQLGPRPKPVAVLKSIVTSGYVLSGFGLYFLSSLLYLQALSRLDLSYAYPMIALSYVGVALGAYWVFGEKLNALRIAGLAVIILGVLMVALSSGGARTT
jgi:drug/metabolite transporter (DMT)-like permease